MMLWMPLLLGMRLSEDERSFMMRICAEYQEIIMRQVRRKVPAQDVEDVYCGVMERLIRNLGQLNELEQIQQRAYVYSTVRSEIASRYRRQSVEQRHTVYMSDGDMEQMAGQAPDMDEMLIFREQVSWMKRAYEKLTDEQQLLLEWKYTQKRNDREIGSMLGISPEAVRKRCSRALKRLREILEEE